MHDLCHISIKQTHMGERRALAPDDCQAAKAIPSATAGSPGDLRWHCGWADARLRSLWAAGLSDRQTGPIRDTFPRISFVFWADIWI